MIFLIVEGTLIWSLVRHRARRGGPDAAQVRGNTPLELGWTLGAALILVVLAVVTFVYLGEIKNPPPSGPSGLQAQKAQFAAIDQPAPPKGGGPTLDIDVNGQQYLWRYDYPGDQLLFSYHEMVVPTDTTVTLEITASDVIHSWWIPKLGGKADAVPGYTNETWFKISEARRLRGQCAELCGEGHADMRAQVRAVTPDEYEAWTQRQRDATSRPRRKASPPSASSARDRKERGNSGRPNRSPSARIARPEVVLHGLRPRQTGWLSWLTTTDHKRIGIMYLFATFLFFILGGVEALIMRLQLAQPDNTLVTRRPTTAWSRCTAPRWSSCSWCRCWPASPTTWCR